MSDQMPKVKFDDLEFNSEDLSAEGQAQLKSLQFLQVQIKRLNAEIEICKRAYTGYVDDLKSELTRLEIKPES